MRGGKAIILIETEEEKENPTWGGGRCGCRRSCCHRCRRCPLICLALAPVVVAPCFHPHEQSLAVGWRGAVRAHRPIVVVEPPPSPSSLTLCSPFPPHEQLLAAAVGGGVVDGGGRHRPCRCSCRAVGGAGSFPSALISPPHLVVAVAVPSLSSCCPLPVFHPASSRSRRQLRVGRRYLDILSPSSFCCRLSSHPPSTLRAVARSGGWPSSSSSCPSVIVVVSCMVPVPVVSQSCRLPTIHPASSGSQR
jgi:hypothetical protein